MQGSQPIGERLGHQGPDQGYILLLARHASKQVLLQAGEALPDAIAGSVAIALRRASKFGRAPVMHDLTFALIIWGWLIDSPPDDLLIKRRELFEGLANIMHHYSDGRKLVDMVPSNTYELTNDQLSNLMPLSWGKLTGVSIE